MKKIPLALTLAVALSTASAQSVRINEFMADNDTIASPAGNKADWIELYNTTSSPVSLAGMYLSDNATNAAKWQFPTGTTIAANGYLVVWAYDTTFAGALYASWSLSKDGEHLRLSAANLSVLDSVTFGLQTKNRSVARIPNGTGAYSSNCLPTLGMTNTCTVTSLRGASPGSASGADFALMPAGAGRFAARFTLAQGARVSLSVLDAQGRAVATLHDGFLGAGAHARVFEAGKLPAGTYWFRLRMGGAEHVRAAVIVR